MPASASPDNRDKQLRNADGTLAISSRLAIEG